MRHQEVGLPIQLEDAELMAMLLFTNERSDLYINLKTTMTGKGIKKDMGNNKEKGDGQISADKGVAEETIQAYNEWKRTFYQHYLPCDTPLKEQRWPLLQLLLQFSALKVIMNQ